MAYPGINTGEEEAHKQQPQQWTSHHTEDAQGDLQHRLAHHTGQVGQADCHQAVEHRCTHSATGTARNTRNTVQQTQLNTH